VQLSEREQLRGNGRHTKDLTPIHSVSVMDYSAPDFMTFGSAALE
jgi:hypothetical protein